MEEHKCLWPFLENGDSLNELMLCSSEPLSSDPLQFAAAHVPPYTKIRTRHAPDDLLIGWMLYSCGSAIEAAL